MGKERLIAFTDAILAIIMTILVLELDHPAQATLAAFWELRQAYFAYALSFFWLGSLWMALNAIWDKAERVDNGVVWWNLLLLFCASLIPYATSLAGEGFDSAVMQGFYGVVVIGMTVVNYFLHRSLARANADLPELVAVTRAYRRTLVPDIAIKCVGLLVAVVAWPPAMMWSVLVAAAYIFVRRHQADVATRPESHER